MAEELPQETPFEEKSDAPPPVRIKKRNVRPKKSAGDMLDPYEYLATTFGKELVEPVDKLPPDCQWYAWRGPADAAALFFDTRKFERFQHIARYTGKVDPSATGACVFF